MNIILLCICVIGVFASFVDTRRSVDVPSACSVAENLIDLLPYSIYFICLPWLQAFQVLGIVELMCTLLYRTPISLYDLLFSGWSEWFVSSAYWLHSRSSDARHWHDARPPKFKRCPLPILKTMAGSCLVSLVTSACRLMLRHLLIQVGNWLQYPMPDLTHMSLSVCQSSGSSLLILNDRLPKSWWYYCDGLLMLRCPGIMNH